MRILCVMLWLAIFIIVSGCSTSSFLKRLNKIEAETQACMVKCSDEKEDLAESFAEAEKRVRRHTEFVDKELTGMISDMEQRIQQQKKEIKEILAKDEDHLFIICRQVFDDYIDAYSVFRDLVLKEQDKHWNLYKSRKLAELEEVKNRQETLKSISNRIQAITKLYEFALRNGSIDKGEDLYFSAELELGGNSANKSYGGQIYEELDEKLKKIYVRIKRKM